MSIIHTLHQIRTHSSEDNEIRSIKYYCGFYTDIVYFSWDSNKLGVCIDKDKKYEAYGVVWRGIEIRRGEVIEYN